MTWADSDTNYCISKSLQHVTFKLQCGALGDSEPLVTAFSTYAEFEREL